MCIMKTERLYLRNLDATDVYVIYDYRNNEECNRYQRWEAFGKEDIEQFVQCFREDVFLSTKEEQHYAICLCENNALVGELAYFFQEGDCITLGISISYRYHHKGYASEMLREVVAKIREKYPDMDIVGLIEKGNCNSIKLFEKLGFVQECYAESIQLYVYVIYGKK